MRLHRPVALVGAAFASLALVLPFVSLPLVGTVDGVAGDAWPALVPIAPVALVAALGDWSRGPRTRVALLTVLSACAAVLLAALKVADAVGAARAVEGATVGPGAFVLLAGTVVVAVGAVFSLRR